MPNITSLPTHPRPNNNSPQIPTRSTYNLHHVRIVVGALRAGTGLARAVNLPEAAATDRRAHLPLALGHIGEERPKWDRRRHLVPVGGLLPTAGVFRWHLSAGGQYNQNLFDRKNLNASCGLPLPISGSLANNQDKTRKNCETKTKRWGPFSPFQQFLFDFDSGDSIEQGCQLC